jgi:hypothetical protein
MKNLIYLLFTAFIFFFAACSNDDVDLERDHVWVINQDGTEVSLEGSWILDSVSHPNSTHTVGNIITFPEDPSVYESFQSDGIYTDPEGIKWTKVNINFANGFQLRLLERVIDSVTPKKLYVVTKTNEDGSAISEYSTDHPFDPPNHDINIWHKN